MNDLPDLNSLEARPAWKVPKILARIGMWLLILSVSMMVVGYVWAYFIFDTINQTEGMNQMLTVMGGNLGQIMMELGFYVLNIAFYAGLLWLMSLLVDKVDQIVWLNASDEDRFEIIQKRKKKYAKNQ